MKNYIVIVILLFSVSLFGKNPPWANKKTDKRFYYGVGMSFKKKASRAHYKSTGERYMNNFIQEARKNAIKNLAENISGVTVSGSDDQAMINLVKTKLQNVEIYKRKEYSKQYWIAVRISKVQVEEIRKQQRMDKARKDLKSGKKDMKKNAFDEEFKDK